MYTTSSYLCSLPSAHIGHLLLRITTLETGHICLHTHILNLQTYHKTLGYVEIENGSGRLLRVLYITPLPMYKSSHGLSIGKTWNACVFEIERPAGEGRDRIRGTQRRGLYGTPTPRRLSSRRRSHSTSYLFRKWAGLQLT